MMGRYSLDREGWCTPIPVTRALRLLVEEGAYASFAADEDGIPPLTADNWFPDDGGAIRAVCPAPSGAETLENLQFIADSLSALRRSKPAKKGGETAQTPAPLSLYSVL